MYDVIEYVDDENQCPFRQWIESLNNPAATRAAIATARMEEGNLGDHHGVGQGVFEHRIHSGPGYRIYFGRDGDKLIVLLGGGTKRRQNRDIKNAQRIWAAYKAEKKGP